MSFSHAQYRAYMCTLASRHVNIRHSSTNERLYEMGIMEILGGAVMNVPHGEYIMVLESTEGELAGEDSDFPIRQRKGAFIICRQADAGDFNDIGRAYNECEDIGDEILRKMYQESEDAINMRPGALPEAAALKDFDPMTVKDHTVRGILNGYYGKRYEFDLAHEFDITQVNEEKWL